MLTKRSNITQYVHSLRDEMEGLLMQLVQAETPSRDKTSQESIFDILSVKFKSLGYNCLRFPGQETGGFLITYPADREKGAPIQLLIGHCDTVWKKGTIQQMPFLREDSVIKGPGSFDMKAGLTQMVYAIKALKDQAIDYPVTPVCLINSDEEIGSRESTTAIRRLAKIADRAFILEPPLGLEGKLKTSRKGLARYTIEVTGVPAHAGLDPGKGASAILELSQQVQVLFGMNDLEKGISVNVGMIEGGTSANVVAPSCSAVIDVRVPTNKDAVEIDKKIKSLSPINELTQIQISGGFGRPPMERTERNQKLWLSAREVAKDIGLDLEEAAAGGGSDANTTSQYTATLDGLGTTGDGAHAHHEHILRDAFVERTALLAMLLQLKPTLHQ